MSGGGEGLADAAAARFIEGLNLARRLGASGARIRYEQGKALGCHFEAGRPKAGGARRYSAYIIEAIAEGRKGTASGNHLASLDTLVRQAVALAAHGPPSAYPEYPPPAPFSPVKAFSERTAALDVPRLAKACAEIGRRLSSFDPALHHEVGASRYAGEGLLLTSSGTDYRYAVSQWSLYGVARRMMNGGLVHACEGRSWRELDGTYDPEEVAGRLIGDLRASEEIIEAPGGAVPLLIPPPVLALFLRGLALGFHGRHVAKGDSPLRGRLGERVFHPRFSLFDQPHRPFSLGATALDDCGIPTRPLVLVQDGIPRNFLYDLDTACLAGAKPTGHNGCLPYGLEVEVGPVPWTALIEGLSDGLLVRHLIGFGQGNLMNGDFACRAGLAFRVRKGRIVGRVKEAMITGNLYDLFGRVTFSAETEPPWDLPYALFEGVPMTFG